MESQKEPGFPVPGLASLACGVASGKLVHSSEPHLYIRDMMCQLAARVQDVRATVALYLHSGTGARSVFSPHPAQTGPQRPQGQCGSLSGWKSTRCSSLLSVMMGREPDRTPRETETKPPEAVVWTRWPQGTPPSVALTLEGRDFNTEFN